MRAYHRRTERWACIVAHRRYGKTVGVVNDLIRTAMTSVKPDTRCAYIAPFYSQAKAIAWDYAKFYSAPIPGIKVNESELRIDYPNGSRLRLFGADNYDAMRGLYFDDAALDEPADFPPNAWPMVIRPALADRQGRATFMGTPKGKNEFWDIHEHAATSPEWFSMVLRASDTGILPQAELEEARRAMGDDRYEQEFECSWSAGLRGSYYAKLIENADQDGRICDVPYDPAMRVVTAWDLGVRDSTAIVFAQMAHAQPRIIDYYEQTGEGLPHYAKHLQSLPYVYGDHIAPHDIEVRELGTGKSRKETAASLGLNFRTLPNMPLGDGIEAVRNFLPRVWIDRKKCAGLIDALSSYRAEVNPRTDELLPHPLHDWSEHGASAVRYLALGMVAQRAKTLPKVNTRWVV